MDLQNRYRGALLGLAAGDAVGTTLEFKPRGSFEPLTDMVGGGPFDLEPGQWTDDTSMALCLAESLIRCDAFDPRDQMNRYANWYQHGYWSSTGTCFDIGVATRGAIHTYLVTGEPLAFGQSSGVRFRYEGDAGGWPGNRQSGIRAGGPLADARHCSGCACDEPDQELAEPAGAASADRSGDQHRRGSNLEQCLLDDGYARRGESGDARNPVDIGCISNGVVAHLALGITGF